MSELCAITTVFNPAGYASRFKLYHDFREQIRRSGITLYTVELAIGNQGFCVTDARDPHHIQLRTGHELWYQENLFNVALKRLPLHFDSVAWIEADVIFVRPDWVSATKKQLEKYRFVQLFSHAVDLGPKFEPLKIREGFVYRYLSGRAELGPRVFDAGGLGKTGYAWAAHRATLEQLGGLIETTIVGSSDYFTALALIEQLTPEKTRRPGTEYAASLMRWQSNCQRYVNGSIGYVDGTILHCWHGRREDRGYDTRWRILLENKFDPQLDLRKNDDGLFELTERNPDLRDAIRRYFRSRNEDCLEA
jgi:hypothetical protein